MGYDELLQIPATSLPGIRDCCLELQAKIEPLSPKLLALPQLERKTKHSIALLSNNVPCS